MDPSQQRDNKLQSQLADESSQAGYMLFGGLVLIIGGIVMVMQANATVADFGGGMLALMGTALIAAAIWIYSRKPGE